MGDGGQCGGLVHTVWCFQRLHFSTPSIWEYTLTTCLLPSEIILPKTGFFFFCIPFFD